MPVNYDLLASRFDERYQYQLFAGIQARLRHLASRPNVRVLEVGCGTGHWLSVLSDLSVELVGADSSFVMLQAARARTPKAELVCASAEFLPFSSDCLDLIFCVNAFHHFSNPEKFIRDSRLLLRTAGQLAIFGLDPHVPNAEWYLHDYFAGVREMDLERYVAHEELKRLMTAAGFRNVVAEPVEHIERTLVGEAVLEDPFLERSRTSQLLLISQNDYERCQRPVCAAIGQGKKRGMEAKFATKLTLFGTIGEA